MRAVVLGLFAKGRAAEMTLEGGFVRFARQHMGGSLASLGVAHC